MACAAKPADDVSQLIFPSCSPAILRCCGQPTTGGSNRLIRRQEFCRRDTPPAHRVARAAPHRTAYRAVVSGESLGLFACMLEAHVVCKIAPSLSVGCAQLAWRTGVRKACRVEGCKLESGPGPVEIIRKTTRRISAMLTHGLAPPFSMLGAATACMS